jgi:glycosyltransferase involved in cell wall biosynthesis
MNRKGEGGLTSLSVFFPAYNDAGSIADLIVRGDQAARTLTDDVEIIVVDDGSRDGTGRVLAELRRQMPALRVITHTHNQGYGGALRSGFSAARKEWIFYTDGDGQYDPAELTHLAAALAPGISVVNGYKRRRSDAWYRVAIGSAYNALVRRLLNLKVRDVVCDFRLMRRSLVQSLSLSSDSGAICVELVRALQDAGGRFAEVEVSHYHRRYGTSQFFTIARVFSTVRQMTRLWWKWTMDARNAMPQHEPE